MKIDDIEIHVGEPDFPYQAIRQLEAKCEASMAFSPAPTVAEMNDKLRSMASKVGANAVINVQYNSGVSMTSWKSMKGTGLAVIRQSDTISCPNCAETIKRAAKICRFCNQPVSQAASPEETVENSTAAVATPDAAKHVPPMNQEPLRETNNPQMWMIVGVVLFLLVFLISL